MMLVLPSTPSGTTIFCDDIRHEVTGKISLIGVYHDIESNAPILIPQLCILSTLRLNQEELPFLGSLKILLEDEDFREDVVQEIEINISSVDEEPLVSRDKIFSDKEGVRYAQFQTQTILMNFLVQKSGRIKIRLFHGDNQIALGALRCVITSQNGIVPIEMPNQG